MSRRTRLPRGLAAAVALVLATAVGCTDDPAGDDAETPTSQFSGTTSEEAADEIPEVLDVSVSTGLTGYHRFEVTISSPYDRPDRYADAWRVVGPDGEVYGTRELAHPHADEQPFTRSLDGVDIPAEVTEVYVEPRDSIGGWSGVLFPVAIE